MTWALDVPSEPPGSSETFRYPPQTSGKFVQGQSVEGAKSIEVVNNSDNYVVLRFDPGGVPVGSAWDLVCPPFVDRVSLFSGDGFTIEADGQGNVPASNHNIMVKTYADRLQPGSYPLPQTQTSSTGIVQVTGTVNVGNSPTVLQGGSSPWQTGNIREYIGSPVVNGTYNALTLVATVPVQNYHTMLFFGTGQSVAQVRVQGHQTGLIFFDAPIAALQIYPIPLLSAQDTSLDFLVRNGATAVSMFINIYSISSAGPVLPLTNYGGAPLTVQPASGSQQTVVPGSAAASSISSATNSVESAWASIASAIAKPVAIYGCAAGAQGTTAPTVAGTNWGTMVNVIARGSTSLKRLYLATFGIVSASTAAAGNDVVAAGGTGPPAVFPYPISCAVYWPSDATIDLGYTLVGVTPSILGVQANLIIA